VSDGAAQLQVLQVEGRLGGAQREVDDESDEGDDEDQRQQAGRQAPAAAAQAVLVRVMVLPLLLAHDDAALRRCGVAEQLNCELVSFFFCLEWVSGACESVMPFKNGWTFLFASDRGSSWKVVQWYILMV
jgi:hypothetical protein